MYLYRTIITVVTVKINAYQIRSTIITVYFIIIFFLKTNIVYYVYKWEAASVYLWKKSLVENGFDTKLILNIF